MQAGINTAKAVRPMQEVMNHAQALSGRRIRLMPFTRRSSVVVMKFNEPSNWPTQKIAIEIAQRTTPVPCPGTSDRTDGIQRGVLRPSAQSRTVTYKKRRDQNQKGRERHPERHHVEAGEGHVFRAHLDGQEK
jgi:hypothetical protein